MISFHASWAPSPTRVTRAVTDEFSRIACPPRPVPDRVPSWLYLKLLQSPRTETRQRGLIHPCSGQGTYEAGLGQKMGGAGDGDERLSGTPEQGSWWGGRRHGRLCSVPQCRARDGRRGRGRRSVRFQLFNRHREGECPSPAGRGHGTAGGARQAGRVATVQGGPGS